MVFNAPRADDYAYLDRLEQIRTTQASVARTASPVLTAQLVNIVRKYPGISPGLAYAFASTGTPGVEKAWQAELATRMNAQPGTKVTIKGKRGRADDKLSPEAAISMFGQYRGDIEKYNKVGREVDQAINTALQGVSDEKIDELVAQLGLEGKNAPGGKGSMRGAEALKAIRDVDPERYLPRKDPGIAGLAMKAVAPVVGLLSEAGNAATGVHDSGPLKIPGLPTSKDVVRGAATVAQAGLEGGVAVARSLATEGEFTDPSTWGQGGNVAMTQTPSEWASSISQQTVLGQTAAGKTSGSGWLPNPSSPAAEAQAEAARKFSPYLVGGHAWTPGRAVAGTVFEPDSDAFNIASGVVDAGVAIYADPANLGLMKLAQARAAGKLLLPDEYTRAGFDLERLDPSDMSVLENVVTRAREPGLDVETLLERAKKVDLNETALFGGEEVGRLRLLADKAYKNSELQSSREAGGLFSGIRQRYEPKRFSDWIQGQQGSHAMNAIAAESDPWTIHMSTGLPVETLDGTRLVDKLAKAGTSDEVVDILRPFVGMEDELRQTFRYDTPGYGSRLFSDVPAPTIHLGEDMDLNNAARQSDLALINARASLEDRKKVFALWAEASDKPKVDTAVRATFETIRTQLKTVGKQSDAVARDLTRYAEQEFRDITNYGHDMMGEQLVNHRLLVDGEMHAQPHPIFDNQFIARTVELPNARAIRRMTSEWAPIFNAGIVKDTVAMGDLAMVPWRRLMLMRPAWGVRVVGEEQIRMAAEGLDSLLSAHPLRAISYAVGSPEDRWITYFEGKGNKEAETLLDLFTAKPAKVVGKALHEVKAQLGRGNASTFSTVETDPFMLAQNLRGPRRFSAIYDETPRVYLDQFGLTRIGDENYPTALVEDLNRMRESQIARKAVEVADPTELKNAFWDGDLADVRTRMATDSRLEQLGHDRLASDAQMDIAYEAINTVTANGNTTLVEALRSGKINGVDLMDGNTVNPAAVAEVQALIDAGVQLPEKMRIRKWLTMSKSDQSKYVAKLGKATDEIFNALMPRPSDYLSRSPTFKQHYWNRLEELIPYMDDTTRARAVSEVDFARIRNHPIGKRIIEKDARLTAMGDAAPAPIITDFDKADQIAKHFGLHQTKDLLYDLSKRSQMADVGRLIAPFAEAWKEIVTRWGKLVYENPRVLRRAAQGAWEVQQPGSQSINMALGEARHTGGFFFKNQFGEEVFAYPGSELITKNLIGVPIPLTGNVSGLNLVGSGMPGIGPIVQVPLSYLLPDKPETDWIAKQLFPFGRSSGNPIGAVVDAYTPAWAKRAIAAFDSPAGNRLFANSVFDAARYLNATGEYDIQGPNAQNEQNRLMSDAKSAARGLYIVRTIGSLTLPTSPSPEWLTVDKKGQLTLAWRVASWYQEKLKETGDSTKAMDAFLERFGVKNILLAQPHSKTVVPAAPSTIDSAAWLRKNPALQEKYPITYGLFAPATGEFDSDTYERQFETGERRQLRPEEMLRLANARLGNYLYATAKDNGASASELRELRQQITDEFPGYQTGSPIQSYNRADVISELQRTVKDRAIRNTPAGKALAQYMALRQTAYDKSKAGGLASPWTSKRAAPLREELRDTAEELIEKYPSFQPIWDAVLAREVGDD